MDEHRGTRGAAFGLGLEADFAIPGLRPAAHASGLPRAVLRLGDERDLARAWRAAAGDAVRVSEGRPGDGEPDRTIDAHPTAGYRLRARYFGSCLVSPDGGRLLCVPPPVVSWRWQRFLVGRCLPLAAMLRGYEVLHAGAAELADGVVAIVGPRGSGKTSLTLHLVLQGGRFFTDDVLSLETRDDGLVAHPGFGVVNVRAAEHERLGEGQRAALGALLGRTGRDKHHYALAAADAAQPLRALYFLVPGASGAQASVVPLDAPEPLRLLMSTFIQEPRPPEHLARLLDVCARLAADVPMFEVAVGGTEDAAALAARLRAHVDVEVPA
jgi:hypothetical protein